MVTTTYFIYAADYSGSTYGDDFYNDNALPTIDYFKKEVKEIIDSEKLNNERIVYLQWGHDCIHVDEETLRNTYITRSGDSTDTRPQEIITWIADNVDLNNSTIRLLYIVTDGMISRKRKITCLEQNADMMYESVVFYAFNSNKASIDMSVAASFFKKQCSVICNGETLNQVNIAESYNYDCININNFRTEKDSLRDYIKLKFLTMSKTNEHSFHEIQKLKQLRNRLFKQMESGNVDPKITFDDVRDKDVFVERFKETDYYKSLKTKMNNSKIEIDKCIATLINYINSDSKSYAFDALKYKKTYKHYVSEETTKDIGNIKWAGEEKVEFPDIITFDESKNVPVILLATYNLPQKIIFHSGSNEPASYSKFKPLLECPLLLLNDKEFMDDCISYFYSVDVYRQLLDTGMTRDPYSGRDTEGGIILSPECDKYNDYILAKNYFDSKAINYTKGLLYYVLWKICEQKEWMDRNVVDKFKQYMLRRISGTKCYIGLSSLPLDPLIKTSLPAALWYCLEISSYIFKDDDKHFSKERLQNYHSVAGYIIDILMNLKYPLNLKFIEARTEVMKYVTILKRIPAKRQKYYFMVSKIFKNVDGFLMSEIEHQENIQKLNYLKLNHKEKLDENVLNDKVDLNGYVYLLDRESPCVENICSETFRPRFVLVDKDEPESFYRSLWNNLKHGAIVKKSNKLSIEYQTAVADRTFGFQRIVSRFKLFIDFVKDNEKYPSLEEYQEYVLNKKKYGPNVLPAIFPINTLNNLKDVHELYGSVIKDTPVAEFIAKTRGSVNRVERIKFETNQRFNTDGDIEDFIKKEYVYLSKSRNE